MKRSRVGLHRFRILLGGRFIYVDVTQLADSIKSRLPGGESDIPRLVGVGTSGSELCERIVDSDNVPRIEVATAKYARERQERRLTIGEIPDINNPILVDDIAVSGLTLGAVSRRVEKTKQTPAAVVGMCMKSKRLNRMVGLGELKRSLVRVNIGEVFEHFPEYVALQGVVQPRIGRIQVRSILRDRIVVLPQDGTFRRITILNRRVLALC